MTNAKYTKKKNQKAIFLRAIQHIFLTRARFISLLVIKRGARGGGGIISTFISQPYLCDTITSAATAQMSPMQLSINAKIDNHGKW
jgi:hypothetical protein